MSGSPTTRTLALLRKDGWTAAVVEKWNPHARIRQDLFGIIDVLAVRDGDTLGVQCTSASNVSSRVQKITDSDALPRLREAGWLVVVHGWRKNTKNRWICRAVDLS